MYSNNELRKKRKFEWSNTYVISDGVEKILGDKCNHEIFPLDQLYNIEIPLCAGVSSNGQIIGRILEEHASMSGCDILDGYLEDLTLTNCSLQYMTLLDTYKGIESEISFRDFINDSARRVLTKHKYNNEDIYVISYVRVSDSCLLARETHILTYFEI